MRLSGLVFLAIGAVVAIASWLLVNSGQKLTLFLWAGVAMAVYGVARLFIDSAMPKEQAKTHAQLQEDLNEAFSKQHSLNKVPRVCSACGTRNHPRANFCGNCGNRL